MDSLILGLRVLVSLGAVLGLMWFLHRRLRRGTGAPKAKALAVVARQAVGPKASVVLVDTDGKRFLLGVTEHGIGVLHTSEAPLPETSAQPEPSALPKPATPAPTRARRRASGAAAFDASLQKQLDAAALPGQAQAGQALAGSILDPGVWKLALGAHRAGHRP
ncbi:MULTISPECIES: flagellar biosynthetic protein FliO [Arthrobacter]|uniref:Flagellar protein n=2 Tax=Arthrobacter TaxID=1663 RepID=A0ABU9KL91_9MICC|nr:flagellar biosynthetic protein FliO [Arthrobacter sp. YJM1]MDP5226330.1 flagellar biosynthetic protein FliO [Arthrobacter sp. YJM1]